MSVHKIRECSEDPIFTATGERFQMHKPSNSRILPKVVHWQDHSPCLKKTTDWFLDVHVLGRKTHVTLIQDNRKLTIFPILKIDSPTIGLIPNATQGAVNVVHPPHTNNTACFYAIIQSHQSWDKHTYNSPRLVIFHADTTWLVCKELTWWYATATC